MANVTFSSPVLDKDVTVYAVAGDRGTILSLAKTHKIPIPFDCQDGECGSCLVEVRHMSPHAKYGIALTEKEKEVLRQLGKITVEEISSAEIHDMPPRFRLACQCFVRDEDIMVIFEGDQTLPAKSPHVSIAAKVYNRVIKIDALEDFLGIAVHVEQEAADHFDNLSVAMTKSGNDEVATLFKQLAGYSRLHLGQAKARAEAFGVTENMMPDHIWPDYRTPEQTDLWAGDSNLSRLDGLKAALQGERRGYEFYYAVEKTTKNKEVADSARAFVKEEAEHVRILEAWIAREEWLQKAHDVPV